jgi:hypothetical protein
MLEDSGCGVFISKELKKIILKGDITLDNLISLLELHIDKGDWLDYKIVRE